jgi:ABC-2 type transport system ATP-binding protein
MWSTPPASHAVHRDLRPCSNSRSRRAPSFSLKTRRVVAAGHALEVEHLHKRYGDHVAVEDVSFAVARGEIFGILGPNGAGKTTTVECAQGLRAPDGGSVHALGLDVGRDSRSLRGRIGSQLQASALPDRLKVWEALDLFASLTPGAANPRELLERWGLAEQRNTVFAELSGGQRQRLFVALALLGARELVFLDELTQGLDAAARRVAWELISEIRDQGCAVVLVTHFMDEAERLCDRLAVLGHGRVIATGSARDLIARSRAGTRVHFTTECADLEWLRSVRGVTEVLRSGRYVEVHGGGALLASVTSALFERGIAPAELRVEQPTLEDAYEQLTTPTREQC